MTIKSMELINNTMAESNKSEPKEEKRDVWNNKIDYLCSSLSYAVGYANIWRFPYLCYKNGGGAFLIPYFICVLVGAIPMLFMEMSLGQFTSSGGMQAWMICPLLKGIGATSSLMMALAQTYYIVITVWVLFYLFASFTSELPWSNCNNTWNTPMCSSDLEHVWNDTHENSTFRIQLNGTFDSNNSMNGDNIKLVDATTEFWERRVLRISSGIHDIGAPNWDLSLCLVLAWCIVYLCCIKGIKTSGKAMYVILIVPYILMLILIVRGVTLPGAVEGIKFYMFPDLTKLSNPMVWADAGTQVFYSYGIALGVIIALGSHNKFNNNFFLDSLVIGFGNSITSVFAGFSIFSVLGFMAHQQGVSVNEVAESGPGLAFIAYPKAVAQMPFPQLWSILFFLMLFMLGLGSQITGFQSLVVAIVDEFPKHLRTGYKYQLVIIALIMVKFSVGMSMVTKGGIYVFQIFDNFAFAKFNVLIGFLQCITVAYIYGVTKYFENLKEMLGFYPNVFMKISWLVTCPSYTLFLFGLSIYSYTEMTYNRIYRYPEWAMFLGWLMATLSPIMIPLFAFIGISKTPGNVKQRMKILLRPNIKGKKDKVFIKTEVNSTVEEDNTFL